jgi:hypothetical protein
MASSAVTTKAKWRNRRIIPAGLKSSHSRFSLPAAHSLRSATTCARGAGHCYHQRGCCPHHNAGRPPNMEGCAHVACQRACGSRLASTLFRKYTNGADHLKSPSKSCCAMSWAISSEGTV